MPGPGGYWLCPRSDRGDGGVEDEPAGRPSRGSPGPRLTLPVCSASCDISAKIVVPKPRMRSTSGCRAHGPSVTIRCCLPGATAATQVATIYRPQTMSAPTVTAWCRDVVKTYDTDRAAGAAITGITKDIPGGALTVVAGPSGCGKSTFLRLLGVRRPSDVRRRRGRGALDRRREQPGAPQAAPPSARLHLPGPDRQPRRVPDRARSAEAVRAVARPAHRRPRGRDRDLRAVRPRAPRSTTSRASSPAASSSG